MDPKRFSDRSPGRVVRITTGTLMGDWAFVPRPLPPVGWELPANLVPLLIQARDRLGNLNGIGRTLPHPQLLLRPLQDREALTSSRLEGTFATPEELLLFSRNPHSPKSARDPDSASEEVYNHTRALTEGLEQLKDRRVLSLQLVRMMHEVLMRGVRGANKAPGEFRRLQVCIGSDHRYVPPPANELPDQLAALQEYMNVAPPGDQTDPLVRSYLSHYQFEAIHPFMDGNGRIGRLLLSFMVYVELDQYMPWLYMSPFLERHKDEYIDRMFRVSTSGDWTGWIRFCLTGTIAQANDSIRRCERLQTLRDEFRSRLGADGSPRTSRIIEDLFTDPLIPMAELARKMNVSYATAKADVNALVEKKILRQLDGVYPATFYSPDIFHIAYSETVE